MTVADLTAERCREQDGTTVHFRRGAPAVRLTGSTGEMLFDTGAQHAGWTLTQDVEVLRPR